MLQSPLKSEGDHHASQAYLEFVWTPEGQEIAAQNYLRPRNADVFKKYASLFPKLSLFTVDEVFGGWKKVQKQHFDDGAVFEQIYLNQK